MYVSDGELREALQRWCSGYQPEASAARRFFPDILERRLAAIAALHHPRTLLRFSYSVKTNPSKPVLDAVRRAGLLAEVISPQEFEHAIASGFSPSDVIYNGPYPARHCAAPPGYVFADSIEAYLGASEAFPHATVGVRLRPPGIASHFGIVQERLSDLAREVRGSGRREIGVSFHVRPEDYGGYVFRTLVQAVVERAQELERYSGAQIIVFDAGGGKRPDEFDRAISSGELEWLEEHIIRALPHVRSVLLEPGQAIVTSSEAVLARVLEVRRREGEVCEVVVNAGFPEMPQIGTFPHRMFWIGAGAVRSLTRGSGRIIGRTCLEYDVLAKDVDLSGIDEGDLLAVADTGAYDASMSFDFAGGRRCP